jgi:hypothetical protein
MQKINKKAQVYLSFLIQAKSVYLILFWFFINLNLDFLKIN